MSDWTTKDILPQPGKRMAITNAGGRAVPENGLDLYVQSVLKHSADDGGVPTLFSTTVPVIEGAAYYDPDRFDEVKESVAPAPIAPRGKDPAVAARLRNVSEQLTGVSWPDDRKGIA